MARHRLSALAGLVLLVATPFASASPVAPAASLTVDGQQFTIPVTSNDDGTYKIGGTNGWQMDTASFDASANGTIDNDPSISYGFSVTDMGTPSTFSFTFTDPITFPAVPSVVSSSVSGALVDAGGDGASLTPTATKLQVSSVANGGPLTDMGVDTGSSFSMPVAPPTTATYGPFNSGPTAGPAGPWSSLQTTAAFTLSGGGDIFSAGGHAEIDAPEPASLSVLAIATLPMLHRRRAK